MYYGGQLSDDSSINSLNKNYTAICVCCIHTVYIKLCQWCHNYIHICHWQRLIAGIIYLISSSIIHVYEKGRATSLFLLWFWRPISWRAFLDRRSLLLCSRSTSINLCVCGCVGGCGWVGVCVCVWVLWVQCLCACVCVFMCVCMCVCACLCVCVCVHKYIICVYVHVRMMCMCILVCVGVGVFNTYFICGGLWLGLGFLGA